MWKFACCSTLLCTLLQLAEGNPVWGNSIPFWKNPCGGIVQVYSISNIEDLKDIHVRSIRKIRQQLKLSQLQLLHYDFDSLLIDAQRGVKRENYIPNWIPDINSVLPVIQNGVQSLTTYPDQLTDMHTDLQKYAIAFEQVWLDETDEVKKRAMTSLVEYLRELLCEVEGTILSLGEPIPDMLPRSLMTPAERTPLGYTDRIVRDNGILIKYREFLNGWVTVFKQARSSLSMQQQQRRKRTVFL